MLLESEVDLVRVLGLLAAIGFALAVLGFVLAARAHGKFRNATAQLDKTSRSHEHVDRRLLQILDAIPVALVETDTSGKFVFANRAAQRLLGRKNSELLGLRFHSATWGITYPDGRVIPPDLLPAARALRGQTVKGFQHLMMNPATRRKLLVSVTAQPVMNDAGEVVGSTAAIVETESLARAGSEEDRLRKLFEFAASPVLAIDVERKVRDLNPAALVLLGRKREDVVGQDFVELFVPAEDRLAIRTAFTEAVSGQGDFVDEAEGRVVRADGQVRTVVWKNAVLRDEQGEAVGVLASGDDVTERRGLAARAEALGEERDRLADSEARFRALAEASVDVMWLAEPETGRMLYVSPAYERLYGESREHLLADPQRWRAYVHPDDAGRVEAAATRLLQDAPRDLEFRIRRPDTGDERHLRDTAFVIRDEAGSPRHVAGLTRDVTEQRLGEESLRRSEARFRAYAEAADDLVWMFDVGVGRFDYMGPAYQTIYGEAREAVLADPRRWLERVHPEDRAICERLADAGASGDRADDEYRIVRPTDGQVRTLRTAVFPIRGDDGEVAVVAGQTRDVTEQRAAEAALRAELETAEQARAQLDAELGERGAALESERRERERLDALAAERASELEALRVERERQDAAAAEQAAELETLAAERVRLEADLARLSDDLAGAEDERGRAERALAQAQRLETVGRLTGGVAHDFDNLLQVVTGALDMILRHADRPERVRRLGEAALAAGRRGETLTRRLLAFSQRQEGAAEPLDVARVVLGLQPRLRRLVGDGGVLAFDAEVGTAFGRVDPVQLEAALAALVENARDAAATTGGRIAVGVETVRLEDGQVADAPAGDYVRLSVADAGVGMSADVLARAWEPFFTTKADAHGAGLGLAQVYGFVRQAGGAAAVATEPGRGTTVSLFLPRAPTPAEDGADAVEREPRPERGRSVLLVEDDAGDRTAAETLLVELGCQVETAGDGPSALARLRAEPSVDLLVADFAPAGGMSGMELAAEARRLRPALRVLLSTDAADGAVDAAEAADLPVLQKPYGVEALSQALRRALG